MGCFHFIGRAQTMLCTLFEDSFLGDALQGYRGANQRKYLFTSPDWVRNIHEFEDVLLALM